MFNTVYQLVRPRQFEAVFHEIHLDQSSILVKPTHLSICNADQRYYQGKRSKDILRQKLPMALIHEGIGKVIYDPDGKYKTGEKVVMIPNVPSESSPVIAENYLRSSKFRGSSMDGFMQECVATRADRLVRLPSSLDNDEVAAFTEMVSVCYHCLQRFDRTAHEKRDIIGIWGDGNMGYFTSLLLRTLYPKARLIVFGVDNEKLNNFSFVDDICNVTEIPRDLLVDHSFECVGGGASAQVIAQMIDHIQPEGTMAILGVSEDPVPVYTRMILEKGLRMIGTSRSGRQDFEGLIGLYAAHPNLTGYLEKMVGAVVPVRGVRDMTAAFDMDIRKEMGKTVMEWNL